MKNKKYFHLLAALSLSASSLMWTACSDDWNVHYNPQDGTMADAPSLLQQIKQKPELAGFLQVLEKTGYDTILASPNKLTVWAPAISQQQADSICALYDTEKLRTNKDDDNKAISQFIKNHIAMYALNVSADSTRKIRLLNGKHIYMNGESTDGGKLVSLDGREFAFGNKAVSNNGFLYSTPAKIAFYPNVREHMDLDERFTEINKVFLTYDRYELDEKASVPGGMKDGQTFYLDSVTTLINDLQERYRGYLDREDSLYMFVAPTNRVMESLLAQYKNYFTYPETGAAEAYRDSLQEVYAMSAMISGRFINLNSGYNQHPQDSLVNTVYYNLQSYAPRTNVYYKPYSSEGFLADVDSVSCSNGVVIVDDALGTGDIPNSGRIKKENTFFTDEHYQAEYPFYYTIPKDDKNQEKYTSTRRETKEDVYSARYDSTFHFNVSGGAFMELNYRSKTENTEITYKLGSTLSNVYYNIYMVTAPALAYNSEAAPEDTLATRHYCTLKYLKLDTDTTEVELKSIDPFVDRDGKGNFIPRAAGQKYFVNKTNCVDTICIAKAQLFPVAGMGNPDGNTVWVTVKGNFQDVSLMNYFTNRLRLDQFILVPFDTKEEAEEYDIKAANRKEE